VSIGGVRKKKMTYSLRTLQPPSELDANKQKLKETLKIEDVCQNNVDRKRLSGT
jgi:hypothetical protein